MLPTKMLFSILFRVMSDENSYKKGNNNIHEKYSGNLCGKLLYRNDLYHSLALEEREKKIHAEKPIDVKKCLD